VYVNSVLLVLIPWVIALLFINPNPTAQLFCGRISQLHDDNGGFLSVPVIEFDGPNPVLV
jgi:hypothetical protein